MTSEQERGTGKGYRKETSVKHGTPTGYKYHECRCERCVEAYRSYHRRYAKLKRQGLVGSKEIPEHAHGTLGGYTNWGCKCDKCRRANADEQSRIKKANAARIVPEDVHGTLNGYTNWMCKCERCRSAMALYSRLRRERIKAGAKRERSAA